MSTFQFVFNMKIYRFSVFTTQKSRLSSGEQLLLRNLVGNLVGVIINLLSNFIV